MTRMFYLRVDDFPAWTESMDAFVPVSAFEDFHAILRSHRIPYMIAATPQPALCPLNPRDHRTRHLTDDECAILKRITGEGVTIGLHGATHHSRHDRSHSEFAGMDDAFFVEVVNYAALELQRLTGVRPQVFVPPFNRITAKQMELLAARFRIVCGGPESVATIGSLGPQVVSGGLYLPSYPPFYGRAHEILDALNGGTTAADPTCLTLHWEWERRRGYSELDRLCAALENRVKHW